MPCGHPIARCHRSNGIAQIFLVLVKLGWTSTENYFGPSPAFEGCFREHLEYLNVELEYVPREAHYKMGMIEANNKAWRGVWNKLVDATGIAGEMEVDAGIVAVSHARNTFIRHCGASPQQAVLGKEMQMPESLLGAPDAVTTRALMTSEQQFARRAEIRSVACRAMYEWNFEQSMVRGANQQARKYRGDYSPGDVVEVFWKYQGAGQRARFLRGHIVAESLLERDGQPVIDRCWVECNGRMLLVRKEDLRDAAGSELWAPTDRDLQEL